MTEATITEQELREMRERCDAATPGEWIWEAQDESMLSLGKKDPRFGMDERHHILSASRCESCQGTESLCLWPHRHDSEFIAHSRTDLPRLLNALQASRAREAELKTSLKTQGVPCIICWTSSWAPCEETDGGAIRLKGGWAVCQQCQVKEWNRTHRARITALEAKAKHHYRDSEYADLQVEFATLESDLAAEKVKREEAEAIAEEFDCKIQRLNETIVGDRAVRSEKLEKAKAERDAAQAETERHKYARDMQEGYEGRLRRELADAEDKRDAALDVCRKYGACHSGCLGDELCTCGWEQAGKVVGDD